MKNSKENNAILHRGGVEWYREKIIDMVNKIEKENVLGYLYRFIELFLEKWG